MSDNENKQTSKQSSQVHILKNQIITINNHWKENKMNKINTVTTLESAPGKEFLNTI